MLKSHGSAILGECGEAPLGGDVVVDSLTKETSARKQANNAIKAVNRGSFPVR
jgi:hypothetical protein